MSALQTTKKLLSKDSEDKDIRPTALSNIKD